MFTITRLALLLLLLLYMLLPPSRALPSAAAARPHIIHIVADDLGWSYVDWHRDPRTASPRGVPLTPRLDALRRAGVTLDRHCEWPKPPSVPVIYTTARHLS